MINKTCFIFTRSTIQVVCATIQEEFRKLAVADVTEGTFASQDLVSPSEAALFLSPFKHVQGPKKALFFSRMRLNRGLKMLFFQKLIPFCIQKYPAWVIVEWIINQQWLDNEI